MSSKNTGYNSDLKGARLVSAEDAWVKGKNGNLRLNTQYQFVGKINLNMPAIKNIGNIKIKTRHKWFVDKFTKKHHK